MTVGFDSCLSRFGDIKQKSENECNIPSSSSFAEACDKLLVDLSEGTESSFEKDFSECVQCCAVEAARMNLSVSELEERLRPVKCAMTDAFVRAFEKHSISLRNKMNSIGWRSSDVESIDWRLLEVVQNKRDGAVNEVRAELTFGVTDGDPVRLLCNRDELSEFQWKVNEARNLLSKLPK